MTEKNIKSRKRFDVALSFPGEYRECVKLVAEGLTRQQLNRERVFYDKWYEAELARLNLDVYLQSIYRDQAELIVVFLCAEYEKKEWCGLEWRAIRDLIKQKQDNAIMPIRFDETATPGLFSIDGYVDAINLGSEEIVSLILQRLTLNLNQQSVRLISSAEQPHRKMRICYNLPVPSKLHTFSFQHIEIKNKKSNLFLFGNKFDIYKQRKQAKYFIEEIGGGIELEMVAIPEGEILLEEVSKVGKTSNLLTGSRTERSINPFFMSKYPITQAQWKAASCLPLINRPLLPSPSKFQGKDYPVESISWSDAVEFCKRLSRKSSRNYRLPTELEWEYACRAGTTTKFHFGNFIDKEFANFLDENNSSANTSKGTTSVDCFEFPNLFGLYDMHGNVYEWCLNRWHKKFNRIVNLNELEENLMEGSIRVIRGGSWRDCSLGCQSSHRSKRASENKADFIGFRVVYLI